MFGREAAAGATSERECITKMSILSGLHLRFPLPGLRGPETLCLHCQSTHQTMSLIAPSVRSPTKKEPESWRNVDPRVENLAIRLGSLTEEDCSVNGVKC